MGASVRYSVLRSIILCIVGTVLLAGCEREGRKAAAESSVSQPAVQPTTHDDSPPDMPAHADRASPSNATEGGKTLQLSGITLTVPDGWESEPVSDGPMAPAAVYRIPNEGGDPGSVRVTHFPKMKGMDDANISRWIAQVSKADGVPSTRDDARIQSEDLGSAQLTIVDLQGSVRLTMRSAPKPNQRMIAAIINHDHGPHFVVAAGDVKLMDEVAASILGFLRSAKPN